MPRTPKNAQSTALIPWDEELSTAATAASAMQVASSGGQFFGLKGGILTWQDAPFADNQMAVVILDGLLENVYYEGEYNAEVPSGPKCFAFGKDEATMRPHQICVDGGTAQSDVCKGCPHNEWGSAARGKGKACRNTQRLALIPAGTLDATGRFEADAPEAWEQAAIGYLRLPLTSVKGYAGYVRQIAASQRRPPYGVITKVQVVPDNKTMFRILFTCLGLVGAQYREAVTARHTEAVNAIDFPYQAWTEPQPRQASQGKLPAQRAAAPALAPRPAAAKLGRPSKY